MSDREAIESALATWPRDLTPKIHYSSPRLDVETRKLKRGRRVEEQIVLPQLRAHADLIDPIGFERFVLDVAGERDFDVMLEAKAKTSPCCGCGSAEREGSGIARRAPHASPSLGRVTAVTVEVDSIEPMRGLTRGFCELALEAADPRALADFYKDVFGWTELSTQTDRIWLECGKRSRLGLWSRGPRIRGRGRRISLRLSIRPGELDQLSESWRPPVDHEVLDYDGGKVRLLEARGQRRRSL